MRIEKIALTGGPCAGKTSALPYVREKIGALGWRVLTVPETATEMIGGGVAPWTCGERRDFQYLRMRLQAEKERVFLDAARTMKDEKILIVCDRGMCDSESYMGKEAFRETAKRLGGSAESFRDSYGAVFFLESAASGAPSRFVTGEGTVRDESAEEARELDARALSAWCGAPHLRIVPCFDDFEDKCARLVREIAAFLGEPRPLEIERKFLIRMPAKEILESPLCARVPISQTYLAAKGERVRRRGEGDGAVYFHTAKRRAGGFSKIEEERVITREEYERYLADADPERREIVKDRYCLAEGDHYFEIDVYPFWKDVAVLEIELLSEDEEFSFPEGIEVIRELTYDSRFSNRAIAKEIPRV